MTPSWGHNERGEWIMLNQREFTAWAAEHEAKRIRRASAASKRQRAWLWSAHRTARLVTPR